MITMNEICMYYVCSTFIYVSGPLKPLVLNIRCYWFTDSCKISRSFRLSEY